MAGGDKEVANPDSWALVFLTGFGGGFIGAAGGFVANLQLAKRKERTDRALVGVNHQREYRLHRKEYLAAAITGLTECLWLDWEVTKAAAFTYRNEWLALGENERQNGKDWLQLDESERQSFKRRFFHGSEIFGPRFEELNRTIVRNVVLYGEWPFGSVAPRGLQLEAIVGPLVRVIGSPGSSALEGSVAQRRVHLYAAIDQLSLLMAAEDSLIRDAVLGENRYIAPTLDYFKEFAGAYLGEEYPKKLTPEFEKLRANVAKGREFMSKHTGPE